YLAFHHMFKLDSRDPDSPLYCDNYRLDPQATWDALMKAPAAQDAAIRTVRADLGSSSIPLAMTESHFALPGRHRNEVLSTWAAGVANARVLNVHQRHGDVLKMATLADFCGTRWNVNALMIPVPWGEAYLTPVGRVMSLYRRHTGTRAVAVRRAPAGLDVVASRRGRRVFLHAVNTNRTRKVSAEFTVEGMEIVAARVHEIAAPPEREIAMHNADTIRPYAKDADPGKTWSFPPASVSAVELRVADATA
ncbi:MAG: alpha-L-arabinofuranosidase C-terminal domain-containing protein, partial [Planctomycetota bacterium]